MQELWILSDRPTQAAAIRRQLDGIFEAHFVELGRIGATEPPQYLLLDVDFTNGSQVAELKEWLRRKPKGGKVVFAVDNSRRMMGLRGRSLPMWTTHFAEPAVHTIKRNDSAHVPAGTSRRSESER